MTHFQAYLLTRLDSFQHLLQGLAEIAIILLVVNGIAQITSFLVTDDTYKVPSYFKITVPLLIVILVIKSLIPTTKEAAFIYVAPAIVNNQDIQKTIKKLPELSGLGLEYLGEILKQEIKETKVEVINEVKKSIK